uniref:V-ATPase proteolipid subunit C-like domain-containing protein n=1 Tax=Moschus moschiferus TaxID=68415 RepID=A0A8C6D6G2_MOSMO
MSVMRPELIMKSIIPVVMAGIIAIYGLVVAVLIANSLNDGISLYRSFLQLGVGLSVFQYSYFPHVAMSYTVWLFCGYFLLLSIVPLLDCTAVYLFIYLFMEIWTASS